MSLSITVLLAAALAAPADSGKGKFEYDPADETVPATMIGGENCYDPQVVVRAGATGGSPASASGSASGGLSTSAEQIWVTWLEFEPGKGDRIWVGTRAAASSRSPEEQKNQEGGQDARPPKEQKEGGRDAARLSSPKSRPPKEDGWAVRKCITPEPGIYKNPTLTIDSSGGYWLSYEQQQGDKWSLAALRLRDDMTTQADAVNLGVGINHRTAPAPDGGVWVVWQAPKEGQFEIRAARIDGERGSTPEAVGTIKNADNWQPAIAALPNGDVRVVWDTRNHEFQTSFDVYVCSRHDGHWRSPELLAGETAFEARAKVTADAAGRVWAVWEEGNENWGARYIAKMRKSSQAHLEITDQNGPLHGFRRLKFAQLINSGERGVEPELPMPAFDKLSHRPNLREGIEQLGGYYEGGELAVDGLGRIWVAYRHYYLPWLGTGYITHKQEDWGIYARCFDGKGWSKLFRCDIGQGDGMQRLCVAPLSDGIVLTYVTGRTDRRAGMSQPGVVMASVHLPGTPYEDKFARVAHVFDQMLVREKAIRHGSVASDYQVFFGDLHRHTDLSLCYVPTDGTMDDAYRYAIDVAGLDFLGITDHSRDIAEGNAKSLLWWRCRKEVSRHDLSPRFIPIFAYEHSRGGEDHNVFSLKPNLWPDTMPFPQLWSQMDNDSFTVPHQTVCKEIPPSGEMPLGLDEKTWKYRDDPHRPLMEIYQGCRDRAIEPDANLALGKGHIMGFIASSDHLSTNASFAGVWAKERTREAIFRAMQARRTFGATDRIRLKVTMGEHWMGEKVAASEVKPIHVEIQGTASVDTIDLIVDGEIKQTLPQKGDQVTTEITLPAMTGSGVHYFYIRVKQSDGNQAWSSPIWIEG